MNGGAPATLTLPCGGESLTLAALSPGSRESLRASVDYDNIRADEPDRFNLVVQRVRTPGSEHIVDQEIFRRVSVVPDTTRFVATALQESQLVRVRGPVPAMRPDRTVRPGSRHPVGYVDSNPDGDDGAPLTDYDVIGSPEAGTGLFALATTEDVRLICIPPLSAIGTSVRAPCWSPTGSAASGTRCSSSIRRPRGPPATRLCRACTSSSSAPSTP